ncbi:MAG: MBL fold metallo-hydrolase, partial [Pseudoflavonifractor sp.]
MYIKIHRGTQQIGGNIIEIGTAKTKLLFDAGANLPPLDDSAYRDSIEIEGLTCGVPSFDAVFVSHHHNDHCGLLERILPDIPVWAGRETSRILGVISDFTSRIPSRITNFFVGGGNCLPTRIGDITITPIGVDHSAYDAYMFLIQAEGKNVLYTGDYRAVEEVPDTVQSLIGIAGKLDV